LFLTNGVLTGRPAPADDGMWLANG
ncbi:MAG: hypothetical protein K0Q72_680, partial [Armatimonadetes bacterium]|nr:hypothetical protein [Armatimonadota bacterium]